MTPLACTLFTPKNKGRKERDSAFLVESALDREKEREIERERERERESNAN